MIPNKDIIKDPNSKYLLALHGSTETLGVGILDLANPKESKRSATFTLGRKLSNQLFDCVEKVLTRSAWKQIDRLAVATGPGGFTGTRVTIAMARIIAQQLKCSLDGFSSFELMASRLAVNLEPNKREEPFWIKDNLKRRGTVAGQYKLQKSNLAFPKPEITELTRPHLITKNEKIYPAINASNDIESDIIELLELSYLKKLKGIKNRWETVLPIYPTSPIDNI